MPTINRKRVAIALLPPTAVLALIHVTALAIYFAADNPDRFGFVKMVGFDYEGNTPTVFSVLLPG